MSSSNHGTASVETLAEVFRCFICMEKLRDARLCPHCSKLCCYPCIRRWLTDQHQCPHCRATLQIQDLVNCRWAEEVTTQLDTLKINEISKQKCEEKDKCEVHKEKLTVYCSTCSKCICHQCALFNGSHSGHSFLPLDDVYKTNVSLVNEHLTKLKRRHVDLICLAQDVERNVENVKMAKDERYREIHNVMQTMQAKLEEQFKIKMDALNAQRTQLSEETELIEHTLHNIEVRLSNNGKAEVINKQQDLLESIQSICQKPMINYVTTPITCDFLSEIVPPYHSNTFIITNFTLRRQNVDPIYSQPLHINGLTWRLKVYPDGNGTVRGTYLSVFLELTTGLSESSKYEYRIEMIHQMSKDLSKNIVREFASDFEVGECWGYNKFFSLDALTSEGFLDIINDTLIIRFQVRPPTYQQQCRDQQWYMKHLEHDNQHLNSEIKSLQEKVLLLISKNRLDGKRISIAGLDDYREGDQHTETVIDISEMNDNDDDEYMFLKSNQTASDDDENNLAENDVENESPSSNSDHSTAGEQNLYRCVSPRSNEAHPGRTTISVTGAGKTSSITTDPVVLNRIRDENDEEVQNAFNASKYESTIFDDALPFIIDDNMILSTILKRSSTNEPNAMLHSNDNSGSVLFRPIPQNNTNESAQTSSGFLPYHPPQSQTSLNNLMLLNSQSYPMRSPNDRQSRPRSHHRRANPTQPNISEEIKSEPNNSIPKK
ncbi:unnamed protein product [Adineta ricciae]|nr:unnamed protein product [Adineta ricciae]